MNERKKNQKGKNAIILTIAVMALAMASLTGCSQKSETQEASNASTESTVETNVDETEKSTEEAEVSSESAPEQTADSASEPAPEPATEVVYEGIDMESDLPGEEWIQTFEGVVDEPLAVIYNDSTGRKEIIQEGSTVNVNPDEDTVAVYLPEDAMDAKSDMPLTEIIGYMDYMILKIDAAELRVASKFPASITVTGGTEDWVVNFTVIPK